MDCLGSIGDFISTRDVLRVLAGERALTRHAFHLSFDDGLKNVLKNALPVLRERSVPAVLFVATSVISNPGKFPHLQRQNAGDTVLLEHASWRDLEGAVAQGFEIGSHTRSHVRLSEISSFDRQMEDEVAGSRQELARRFGACNYMSWPYGGPADIDARSLAAIEKAGYHACFGAFRGRIEPGVTNRFKIPRHHFEPDWPLSHVRFFAHGAGEP